MNGDNINIYRVEIETTDDGDYMVAQTWYQGDLIHNEFGPAFLRYEPYSGNLIEMRWHQRGRPYRDPFYGPTIIKYDADTQNVIEENYLANGRLHRVSGPARIKYDGKSGELVSAEHFRFGEPYFPTADELDTLKPK